MSAVRGSSFSIFLTTDFMEYFIKLMEPLYQKKKSV